MVYIFPFEDAYGPSISQLLFADDSLVFCKATKKECDEVNLVLGMYKKASGQLVNVGKSSILFNSNTFEDTRKECRDILGFSNSSENWKYLGMPYIIGRSKKVVVMGIKDKVISRIKGWKGRFTNPAGREVLIKSILLTMPTYAMTCIKLPYGVCQQLNSIIAIFFLERSKGS